MANIIRRSQLVGLMAMDRKTAKRYDTVEDVWVDRAGRVAYFAGRQGYIATKQVAVVGPDAVFTYTQTEMDRPANLYRLHQLPVLNPLTNAPWGWIEDFLFDWKTGNIAAYVISGEIAEPFGGRAVLRAEDVDVIDTEGVVVKEDANYRLQSESEGLKGLLSGKSQPVKKLAKRMRDRLSSLISPQGREGGRANAGQRDRYTLKTANQFLQQQWNSMQHNVKRAGHRMKSALDRAWQRLTHQF